MNDLKKLVAKANSSLSPRQKKSNARYGLANFIAASTDQMLMTRGGYGGGSGGDYLFPSSGGAAGIVGAAWNSTPNGTSSFHTASTLGLAPAQASVSSAANAGVSSATTVGAVLTWTYISAVTKTPWALLGSFAAGYYNNAWSQYKAYIQKVKDARGGIKK